MPKEYLKLKQVNCKHCYRCIRNCPVKAISFSHEQAQIVESECILCGRCFVNCPQNAKEIRNDLPAARALLASGAPVHASVAPSFVANYHGMGITAMERALKKLGFAGVSETAVGAAIVKNRYDAMLEEAEQKVIISSCCHSITMLLQRHFPEALPFLAPVASPMQAHCRAIKEEHPGAKTVFIGPCISKKAEAELYPGAVDCVLTFEELSTWLAEENVSLKKTADKGERGKTRLFPTTGGILRSMKRPNPDYSYITIDGVGNCIRAVRDILEGGLDNCFIEMSACSGSCIGGPIMEKAKVAPIREFTSVNRYAGSRDFTVAMPEKNALARHFKAEKRPGVTISESAIAEVLRQTGKTDPEHELNCGTCGYNTCREKAAAVIMGKADVSMCLPFLKARAESFSDSIITHTPNGIIVLNESLVVQQVNQAACRILNLQCAYDLVGSQVVRVLDPDVFVEVLNNKRDIYDRQIYLAEYRRYVRQTIIHDREFHIIILIMRDVTEEETARGQGLAISRQAAEVTNEVIEKQMRVVQDIASLLGETAAETKIALTRLKESLKLE